MPKQASVKGAVQPLVTIQGVHFNRGRRVIFGGVDFVIKRGHITAIMGPSGCGKTTLLRLIGGQLTPNRGRIIFEGHNIPDLSQRALFAIRRHMGMLFQSGALFSDLTVYENVAFPLREHTHLPESMIRDLVLLKLQAVGLRGAVDLMPAELSGGMSRRVALARAMAMDPTLLMFDEPFAGQDPISVATLLELIRQVNRTLGITIVVVSHDVPEVMSVADDIYVISEGKIMGHGTPSQIRESDNPWIAQFVQGLPDGPVAFHYPAVAFAEDLWGAD